MVVHTVSQAKAQLSKLLAKVEAGEEIVIGRNGKPIAKLVPVTPRRRDWKPGALKGTIWMAPDYDEWPEDIARALYIID